MSKVATGGTYRVPTQRQPSNRNTNSANNCLRWKKGPANSASKSSSIVLLWFGAALLLGFGFPVLWSFRQLHGIVGEPNHPLAVVPAEIDLHQHGHEHSGNNNGRNELSGTRNKTSTTAAGVTTPAATAGFVHLGKTAGSTLSGLLRNGCHFFVKPKPCHVVPNETTISRLVEAYYHVPDYHRLPKSRHQIYILSSRDVYDRTVSSFLYHHPKNIPFYNLTVTGPMLVNGPIAYKCFPTLEAFASLLQRGNATDCDYPYRHFEIVTDNCSELACAVIHGRVRHFIHLFFNYRNIYAKLPNTQPERRLFVIRKEHLWDDWWKVNTILAAEEQKLYPQPLWSRDSSKEDNLRNVTGIDLPVSRDISDAQRDRLCKALEPEYRVYFQILQRAENMNPRDRKDARELAAKNCPSLDFRSMLAE